MFRETCFVICATGPSTSSGLVAQITKHENALLTQRPLMNVIVKRPRAWFNALPLGSIGGVAHAAGDEDIGHISVDDLLDLLVGGSTLFRGATRNGDACIKQFVNLRVVIANEVEAAAGRIELGVPEGIVIRVGAEAGPTDDDHVVGLSQHLLDHDAKVDGLEVDLKANLVS